jgi:tRNA pseudouridine38-40 synthase
VDLEETLEPSKLYNLNAILPSDIGIRQITPVKSDQHARFDAVAREYQYTVYNFKDPFLNDFGYYFPYSVDMDLLEQAAEAVIGQHDFTSFSKRNTQVKTFICTIEHSYWVKQGHQYCYYVRGNRFLRGMVRGLVGTMLRVGRKVMTIEQFDQVIAAKDCSKADFSVPGKGLCLQKVEYPHLYFG